MKKLISVIIIVLNLLQFTNVQCLAKCEDPFITAKGLNLDSTILNKKGFFEKSFDDKDVRITVIDKVSEFVSNLERKTLTNVFKKIITSWNANLNEKTMDMISSVIIDVLSGKYGTKNEKALIKAIKYIKEMSSNTTLSEEELIKSIEEGKIKAKIGLTTSKGVGIAGGGLAGIVTAAFIPTAAKTTGIAVGAVGSSAVTSVITAAAAKLSAIAGYISTFATSANSLELANMAGYFSASSAGLLGQAPALATVAGTTVASIVTPILIVGATVGASYVSYNSLSYLIKKIYNKYFSEMPYNKAIDEFLKNFSLFKDIEKAVCEHEWIGSNVLTTTTSKEKYCDKTFANFEKIKNVNSNRTKEEINNDFAALECKLLKYPEGHPKNEDCKKEALKSINCYWENIYDISKCKLNPYYKIDIEQSAIVEKTSNEDL